MEDLGCLNINKDKINGASITNYDRNNTGSFPISPAGPNDQEDKSYQECSNKCPQSHTGSNRAVDNHLTVADDRTDDHANRNTDSEHCAPVHIQTRTFIRSVIIVSVVVAVVVVVLAKLFVCSLACRGLGCTGCGIVCGVCSVGAGWGWLGGFILTTIGENTTLKAGLH